MTQLSQPITSDDHILGAINAPVMLVLYGDYQCPYTRRAMTHVKAMQRQIGEPLGFIYRHFPAPPHIHPHARAATEAALAANAQNKFWDMHAVLFRNQNALTERDLAAYAAQVGLDMIRFEQETADHIHQQRMWQDLQSGWDSGVRGAPVLFVNGELYEGEPRLASLTTAVKQALERAA